MNVQDLIELLNGIEDKSKTILVLDEFGWTNVLDIEEDNDAIRLHAV